MGDAPRPVLLLNGGQGEKGQLRAFPNSSLPNADDGLCRASPLGAERSGSVTESCRSGHMSGGLSHGRPLIIVDDVPPEPVRAAAYDIACRASKVNIPAVRTFAFN